jgi:hypothetical protein
MKSVSLIALLFLISGGSVFSQEGKKAFTVNGYVNTLQTVMFDSLNGKFSNDNLLHNRINLKAYINNHISISAESRNRLFTGDQIRLNNQYAQFIGTDHGWIDMSWNVINKQSFLLNTTVDRFLIDFNYSRFQASIGRQRINWSQTFVWNPNDIFNSYSFFDVDYIEKAGSDAIRIQYYLTSSSTFEFAVKANNNNQITAGGLFKFNKWGYDIQFLGGYMNSQDIVAGTGWSGSLGTISFRGEASWFQPSRHLADSASRGIFTLSLDKTFKKNSTAQIQIMYCYNPLKFDDFTSFYYGSLSAKDLAFSKFTAFGQFSWSINPLLNLNMSLMWFPDLKGYFAGPSMDYSLTENVDFSLIWQHFESQIYGVKQRINLGFLKVKYSF